MATTKHQGGCQCGAVRYEVELDLSQPVIACNCSMCGKSGTLLSFVPEGSFELTAGADNLQDYKFNNHIISHMFCKTCGIKSFARGKSPDGSATAAINVRCLDDVDIGVLERKQVDGKSF